MIYTGKPRHRPDKFTWRRPGPRGARGAMAAVMVVSFMVDGDDGTDEGQETPRIMSRVT